MRTAWTLVLLLAIAGVPGVDRRWTFAEMLACSTVQSAPIAAAANAYLMDKYGI